MLLRHMKRKPTNSVCFNGTRLTVARELAGLSMSDLARRVDASRQSIQFLERGARNPSPELVHALAEELGFLDTFFEKSMDERPIEEACSFRRRSTARVWMRRQAVAHAALVHQLTTELQDQYRVKFPALDIPATEVRSLWEIDAAAELCRERWAVGTGPIANMTRLVERAGVVVCDTIDQDEIDAVSWHGPRPIMVQSVSKQSPSRSRFDLAHELGHIVLHRASPSVTQAEEREADRFASALLLPATSFRREFPRAERLHWPALFDLKARWGVSIAAIVRRAYDLGLITAAKYRSAYVQIRARGWHRGEPNEPEPEHPEALPNAVKAVLRRGKTSFHGLAVELGWPDWRLGRLTGIANESSSVVPFRAPTDGVPIPTPIRTPGLQSAHDD